MRMRRRLGVMVLGLAVIALFLGRGRASAGPIYDAAANFSIASNPNGVWTYGYSSTLTPGAGLTLYTMTTNGLGGNPESH